VDPLTDATPNSGQSRPLTIGIVAGEASGDQLAASVITALRDRVDDLRVVGVGGERMAAAGAELWSDYEPIAVMGLFEVVSHLPRLLRFRRDIKRRFLDARPDIVLGVDSPDFNLGLEKALRSDGLRTAHLVSPSVWAWRPERVHTVAESVDQLLCLLPFEPRYYEALPLDTRFVGHPLADELEPPVDRAAAKRALIGETAPLLALLPGSRAGELKRLLPEMTRAVARLLERHREMRVCVPLAEERLRPLVDAALAAHDLGDRVQISVGDARRVLAAADISLLASGTVALEAALLDCPMVVTYRLAGPSYWLLDRLELLQIDRFALPNLIGDRDTVPELIQSAHRAELMVAAIEDVLAGAGQTQRNAFEGIRTALARDAAAGCADALLDGLKTQESVSR
jgi:lipid-A-disaccharide synthase